MKIILVLFVLLMTICGRIQISVAGTSHSVLSTTAAIAKADPKPQCGEECTEDWCYRVYQLTDDFEPKLIRDTRFNPVEIGKLEFIGSPDFYPHVYKLHKQGGNCGISTKCDEVQCGYKAPSFESLCNATTKGRLLFVCHISKGELESNWKFPKSLDEKIQTEVWRDFIKANKLLKCASTNCTRWDGHKLSKNPFYRSCVDDLVTYDDFLTYGNVRMNERAATKSHFCNLFMHTNTYSLSTDTRYAPMVMAGPSPEDYSDLNKDNTPYLMNDFRMFQYFAGNETMFGKSFYFCGATNPREKCNWKDHFIALQNHIRMVNITLERKLEENKLNIQCPLLTSKLSYNETIVRTHLCHSKDSDNNPNYIMKQNEPCYCSYDDKCIKLTNYSGCASKVREMFDKQVNVSARSVFANVCLGLPRTQITNGTMDCFIVDLESTVENEPNSYHTVCCCASDCEQKAELLAENRPSQSTAPLSINEYPAL